MFSSFEPCQPFHVVDVLKKAKEMALSGRDIVHMEAGEPDFSTVQPIIDAAKKALESIRKSIILFACCSVKCLL